MPSSEIGWANSAPSLSPAIHLTTALARSRPGSISQTREPTSNSASDAAMKPFSEMLRTLASTPLAPSSRIFASRSTGTRESRLRSVTSSAIRALIIPKLISIRDLPQRSREGQADTAVLDPSHLCPDEAVVNKLQWQPFTYVRNVREDDHRARFRHVDQLDDMLAATKFHDSGAGDGGMTRFDAFVDAALLAPRDHRTIERKTGRHAICLPIQARPA